MRSAAFLVAALTAAAFAPQEPFKGGTKTVAVYTTVTAMDGRLVTDLGREVFEVEDNGKRQDITVFANDEQPITVVILLDRSGSMLANFGLEEAAAERFVEAMSPADKARIGSFSDRIQLDPRDFTSDHGELIDILHTELQDEGPTPLWNAVNVGITALLHQQGRRVVLVFTDGADNPANGSPNNNSLKDVMKRAEEEDIMVYAIGLAGQNGGSRGGGGGGGRGFGGRGGFGGFGGPRGGFTRGGNVPFDKPDEGLPKIATATGGGYFELMSATDLTAAFARVAEELHHQYVLGFTPLNLDGKIHKLEVHVAMPGLTPRARKTYLARP